LNLTFFMNKVFKPPPNITNPKILLNQQIYQQQQQQQDESKLKKVR